MIRKMWGGFYLLGVRFYHFGLPLALLGSEIMVVMRKKTMQLLQRFFCNNT